MSCCSKSSVASCCSDIAPKLVGFPIVQKRCVSLARVQPKGPLEGQPSSQSWGLLVLKTPDVVFVHGFMYDENLATGLGHRVLVRVCNLLAKVAWVVHPSICRRNESYDSRFIPPFSGCQWHSGTLRSLGLIWDHLLTHLARFLGSIRRCVVRYNLPGWSRVTMASVTSLII